VEQFELMRLLLHSAKASAVQVTDDSLIVNLTDGRTILVPIGWFPRLSNSAAQERSNFILIGEGTSIHLDC
jgi:hypothetical protein